MTNTANLETIASSLIEDCQSALEDDGNFVVAAEDLLPLLRDWQKRSTAVEPSLLHRVLESGRLTGHALADEIRAELSDEWEDACKRMSNNHRTLSAETLHALANEIERLRGQLGAANKHCAILIEQREGLRPVGEPPASRSVQRRVAAMKGEPAPTFGPKEKLICGKCGWHSESDTALFCSHCGKPLPGDI